MFDLTEQFLVQLVEIIPASLGIYLIFNFTRMLLFKE